MQMPEIKANRSAEAANLSPLETVLKVSNCRLKICQIRKAVRIECTRQKT